MFHRHKWSDSKDGYQYCTICNIARPMPCCHKWEIIDHYAVYRFKLVKDYGYILQCKECGELDEYTTESAG